MSAIYRSAASGAYKHSGWTTYTNAAATKENVEAVELDGTGGVVSVTRALSAPLAIGETITIGMRFAVVGPDTGSLVGTEFFMGLCTGHAARYGQGAPNEYCIGIGHQSVPQIASGTTLATTSPTPNQNYQWNWVMRPLSMVAGSRTLASLASGFAYYYHRANQDFADGGILQSHKNHNWSWNVAAITKLSATGYRCVLRGTGTPSYNGYVSRYNWRRTVFDFQFGTGNLMDVYGPFPDRNLIEGVGPGSTGTYGTLTLADVDFSHLNVAWKSTNVGSKLVFRGVVINRSKDALTSSVIA